MIYLNDSETLQITKAASSVVAYTSHGGTGHHKFVGSLRIGSSAESTAALDVSSTTQGFLPPRMTEAQRDAISSAAAGLMVYNTDTSKLNFWNGSAWEAVTSA